MKNILLLGEPMALLMANTTGPLESVEQFTRSLSGAEVNVAVGLTRLGHHATYFTRLGDDPFGHYIQQSLTAEGIDTQWITFDSQYRTGIQLKNMVEDGSDPHAPYYRLGSAASHLTPLMVDALSLDQVDWVHVTGIFPALSPQCHQATLRLMERAKAAGIPISFDPNLRPALWPDEDTMVNILNELSAMADLVLPGIGECQILAKTSDLHQAAQFYHHLGVPQVVIKNGAHGAYTSTGQGEANVPGFTVHKVVDTVGAGDGFAVGVIDGLLKGLPLAQAARQGNAIGAMQVMCRGDNAGLPTAEALAQFMA